MAAAYESYIIGKAANEVKLVTVTEGVPSDVDLTASVTIQITDFNGAIIKAVDSAE